MDLKEAFFRISKVEDKAIGNNISWQGIGVWPIVRQCLWFELTHETEETNRKQTHWFTQLLQRAINWVYTATFSLFNRVPITGSETTAFISRPIYLQALPNRAFFDRIVDPLIFCMPSNVVYAKYYVSPWPNFIKLNYPATFLQPVRLSSEDISEEHRDLLTLVANEVGIDPKKLIYRYKKDLNAFTCWLQAARQFLKSRKNLDTIYLTSWYFPDMMALVTAARECGIKTIELQHGKQGKFNAMYSGWRIPEKGYQMMPDIFWNWGKPSAEHILATSPDRCIHRPSIAGFPWIDYYRQHVLFQPASDFKEKKRSVLVTIQSPEGENNQPIPDFIIDFMRECPKEVFFIFRCHPSLKDGPEYCRHRLSELPSDLYIIDDVGRNLYDILMGVTHHITAYSSCCYEASVFGVPTLLFGRDSWAFYKDEIDKGIFSWTLGSSEDLALWLEKNNSPKDANDEGYIISSLERTSYILQRAKYLSFDYHELKDLEDA